MNLHVYIINVIVCVSIIIFCGVKVLTDPRPETTSIFLPIMSGIVGYFVPNPALKKKEDRTVFSNSLLTAHNSNTSNTSNTSNNSGSISPPSPPLSPSLTIDIPHRINNI